MSAFAVFCDVIVVQCEGVLYAQKNFYTFL